MPFTLPADPGGYSTLDEVNGESIYDSNDGSVDVRKSWSIEAIDGGVLRAAGPGLELVGPGAVRNVNAYGTSQSTEGHTS